MSCVKVFVWRQLELRVFCAAASVAALFIFKEDKMENQNNSPQEINEQSTTTNTPNYYLDKLKEIAKKPWFWIAILAILIVIIVIASTPSAETAPTNQKSDFEVKILNTRVRNESEFMITYEFTNNSSSAISFYDAFDYAAYQNKIALKESYHYEYGRLSSRDVAPGGTIEFAIFYYITDKSSPVEVTVTQQIGSGNKRISQTFNLQ